MCTLFWHIYHFEKGKLKRIPICFVHFYETTLSIIQLTKNINDNRIGGKRCKEFHFVGFLFLGAFATNNSHATTRDVQTCGSSGAVKRGFREKGWIASTCLGIQIRPSMPKSSNLLLAPLAIHPHQLAHCPKSNGLR